MKGFTLIEVLITVFILAVAMAGVLAIFPVGIQLERSAKMTNTASWLAQAKVEEISSTPYDEISCGSFVEPYGFDPDFSSFQRETKINYVDPEQALNSVSFDSGIKKIEVSVIWEPSGYLAEKEVKIFTLIAKN